MVSGPCAAYLVDIMHSRSAESVAANKFVNLMPTHLSSPRMRTELFPCSQRLSTLVDFCGTHCSASFDQFYWSRACLCYHRSPGLGRLRVSTSDPPFNSYAYGSPCHQNIVVRHSLRQTTEGMERCRVFHNDK